MTRQKLYSILTACFLTPAAFFSTSCERDFYLTEKEFYALRGQLATQDTANQVFGGLRNQQLQIAFDNSVSPPRVSGSNLQDFLRNHVPTLGILEGYPSNALRIDRVSGEIERQFDNWLSAQLRLYAGSNNAQVRLERVEAMRILFRENPTFSFSENRIVFDAPLRIAVDCRVMVDVADPVTDFFFGVDGTHDLTITVEELRARGETTFPATAEDFSSLQFVLHPTVAGSVLVNARGGGRVSDLVRNGIGTFVKKSLSSSVEKTFVQRYDHFALSNCRVGGAFRCEYRRLPASPNPELHVVARGADNRLYAAVRRDDVWSNYAEIPATAPPTGRRSPPTRLSFNSDPNLAVSGPATVELAAVTTGGGLFYAQYQNGWKNQHYLNPGSRAGYTGKPALVASAPGQVEIVVARRGGSLVHLRRTNGVWGEPAVLRFPARVSDAANSPALAYSDPTTVQSGNKIFLAAAGSDSRHYAMVFDLETGLWSQSSRLDSSEPVKFAPAAASSGDGQIDLVYVGQSGTPYHRQISVGGDNIRPNVGTSGFSFRPEAAIPGSVNAAPLLVASGYRQLGLVARGTDNRLYYNHYVGDYSPGGSVDGRNIARGWSGWGDLNGNFYGTRLWANGQTQEFALTSTKTGKLDVISLQRGELRPRYALHHNSFDAAIFGRNPWKTVHWRGDHKIGSRQIAGRPAAAALDGNFELAFIDRNLTIRHARRGVDFAQLSAAFRVLSSPAPAEPSMAAGGKGLVDFVTVGRDRKIHHLRHINRHIALPPAALPGQSNLTFQTRPAVVGYGDGQLDVLAVSTTGSIYYWRYLNGSWQNPRQIPGSVAGLPVLVHTGSGQLELFAVGGDNKLYRWRFAGGDWGNWQQIPGAFTINPTKFGAGSAMTYGDGTVDLVVGGSGRSPDPDGGGIYYRHFEPRDDTVSQPGQPAQTFRLLGSRGEQPFIGAVGRTEKFVVVGNPPSRSFDYYWLDDAGAWRRGHILDKNSGMRIGGVVTAPGGAIAVAIDSRGKIYYHPRLSAANPSFDFAPVPGQASQPGLQSPFFRPAVASHGGP